MTLKLQRSNGRVVVLLCIAGQLRRSSTASWLVLAHNEVVDHGVKLVVVNVAAT